MRPDCHQCEHGGTVSGSASLRCLHPVTGLHANDRTDDYKAVLATAAQTGPVCHLEAAAALGIKPNYIGVKRGWFNWPWDFDPVWLLECNGFSSREGVIHVEHDRPNNTMTQ